MRIVLPVLTLCIGGAQRMLVELANGMTARGHEVILLMPKTAEVEYPLQATIQWVSGFMMQEPDFPAADVIVSNFYSTVINAQEASDRGKGVHVRLSLAYEPCVLPVNDKSFPSYHVTRHVLVLSEWQRELIRLNHGIHSHVVPIGVSPTFKNRHIRAHLGPELRIVAVVRRPEGGFSTHREQDFLMQTLLAVKRQYPGVQLSLICPPAEFASSPSLQELSRQGNFRLLTPADDEEMCYHYNEADIFVSSSAYDSGSIPGLEAMRCGAALAAVYAGGNMDYCRPGHNCLMSYRYENRLSEDILHLIEHAGLRRRLAQAGECDSLDWTWQRSVDAFETALKQILACH